MDMTPRPILNHNWVWADRGGGQGIAGIPRHGPECWDAGMLGCWGGHWGGHWDAGVDIGMLGWTLGCWDGHDTAPHFWTTIGFWLIGGGGQEIAGICQMAGRG